MSKQEKMSNEETQKMKEQMAEQFKIDNIMKSFLSVMAQKGWESLGTMANPYSGTTEVSLENAKLSIDTVDFLFNKIVNMLDEKEKGEIRSNLTNMKMTYVKQMKSAQAENEKEKEE
ncbi:DUF1844 domain-containing protein [bacterium]|nr:DUF1844 domain-containing protein [bacterium]